MLVGGDDRFGERVERGVLRGGQERQLRRRLARLNGGEGLRRPIGDVGPDRDRADRLHRRPAGKPHRLGHVLLGVDIRHAALALERSEGHVRSAGAELQHE